MKLINASFVTLLVLQIVCGNTAPSGRNVSLYQSASTAAKLYPNAKAQANQLNDAVISGDYEKAADLTLPKLLQLIGGQAKFVAAMKAGMAETQSDKFRTISSVADEPIDVIEVGSDVYAILPTTMKFKVPEGVLVGQSYMVGVSNDRAERWTFVDAPNGFNPQDLKTLFPAVADRLKVPETKRPVLFSTP